jgi:tetratricopeptide (TPR) repeat protein
LYHPNRDTLERFACGEIPAVEARWIEGHLRSGCPICQHSIDALLPKAPDSSGHGLAAGGSVVAGTPGMSLTAQDLPAGRHREPAQPIGAGGWLDPASGDTADSSVWNRMFAKVGRRVTLITSERRPAPRLLAELLAFDAEERAAVVRGSRRFQTLALCDLLIEASGEAGLHDGAEAIALAELGILMAQHLDESYYGTAIVHDVEGRAWAYLGRARRLNADLAGAKQALAIAETLAERGSADPLEEAQLLDLKATLLSDQGSFEEAAELMDTVIDIYEEVQDPHRKGQSLIAKGLYLGLAGRPELAIALLREGISQLDPGIEPRLALQARHSLAWFLNDCGDCVRAQQELDGCRQARGTLWDPEMAVRSEWLEARIAHRAGRFEEAEARFRRLRHRFADLDCRYEALIVTLDLASLYLEQGRNAEIYRLTDEILPVFLAKDLFPQAAAALGVLQQPTGPHRVGPNLVQELARHLRRPSPSQDRAASTSI